MAGLRALTKPHSLRRLSEPRVPLSTTAERLSASLTLNRFATLVERHRSWLVPATINPQMCLQALRSVANELIDPSSTMVSPTSGNEMKGQSALVQSAPGGFSGVNKMHDRVWNAFNIVRNFRRLCDDERSRTNFDPLTRLSPSEYRDVWETAVNLADDVLIPQVHRHYYPSSAAKTSRRTPSSSPDSASARSTPVSFSSRPKLPSMISSDDAGRITSLPPYYHFEYAPRGLSNRNGQGSSPSDPTYYAPPTPLPTPVSMERGSSYSLPSSPAQAQNRSSLRLGRE